MPHEFFQFGTQPQPSRTVVGGQALERIARIELQLLAFEVDLNALFEQAWSQTGQALEVHLQRNLELIRQHPADPEIGARLDAGIKMAEVRFNPEYADTLKRARAAAERRS